MNVIIMAGGVGTRFWPLSRARQPKQFLQMFGNRSLLEETLMRIAPLVEERDVFTVVHEAHRALAEEILRGRDVRLLTEPLARSTAPCIGLGLVHILEERGDSPVVVLPADHYIGEVEIFQETIRRAIALVDDGGVATIGIVPTRPETGYGYIQAGKPISVPVKAFHVTAFVEKPSLEVATRYLSEGGYYWNAGIFVFRAQTMMEEIKRCLPDTYEQLQYLRQHLGKSGYDTALRKAYQAITPISIDYGVMEKTSANVYVIPGQFPWSDVGSWQSVFEMRHGERDDEGNLVDGDALLFDCKNTFVHARSARLIGCIGVEDLCIIDTPDALLVCHLECSQDVRRCVECLQEKGLEHLI